MEPDYIPDPQYDPPPESDGSPDSYEASLEITSFIPDLSGHDLLNSVTSAVLKSQKRIESLEKRVAKLEASADLNSDVEIAFLYSMLYRGVQCSAQRGSQRANCTIIEVHECEDKTKTKYTVLFEDSTTPLKGFPLERISLDRILRTSGDTRCHYDSRQMCKELLANP